MYVICLLPVYLPVYLSIHHHLHIIPIAGTVGALPNLDTHLPHIGQLLRFPMASICDSLPEGYLWR